MSALLLPRLPLTSAGPEALSLLARAAQTILETSTDRLPVVSGTTQTFQTPDLVLTVTPEGGPGAEVFAETRVGAPAEVQLRVDGDWKRLVGVPMLDFSDGLHQAAGILALACALQGASLPERPEHVAQLRQRLGTMHLGDGPGRHRRVDPSGFGAEPTGQEGFLITLRTREGWAYLSPELGLVCWYGRGASVSTGASAAQQHAWAGELFELMLLEEIGQLGHRIPMMQRVRMALRGLLPHHAADQTTARGAFQAKLRSGRSAP